MGGHLNEKCDKKAQGGPAVFVNTPELIPYQNFVMGMLTVWEEELLDFKECRHDVIETNRTGYFNDTTKEKEFPLK